MALINRVKEKIIEPDFPLMIQELKKAGYTYPELSEITGLGVEHLRIVANDVNTAPKGWTGAVKLLDLYMMACKNV